LARAFALGTSADIQDVFVAGEPLASALLESNRR
jgi:hypothetical protein